MMSPYDAIIDSVRSDLVRLNFVLETDEGAGMTFRRGKFTLDFNTEQYYHPTLQSLLGYADESGQQEKFHVATVMRVMAPSLLLQLRTRFDHQTYEGTKDALKFEIQFLETYETEIFSDPPSYGNACREAEVEDLRRAGFNVGDDGAPH